MRPNHNKAFSLIELSIVILIIGIIIAGVTQSTRLVYKFRLNSARTLTKSSNVSGIKGLQVWLETTLEESFDKTIDADDSSKNSVVNWYDINPQLNPKFDATQSNSSYVPTYVNSDIKKLPVVRFNQSEQDFLNLPDGAVPTNISKYTIFFTLRLQSNTSHRMFLSSGTASNGLYNGFRYTTTGSFTNLWWGNDVSSPAQSYVYDSQFHVVGFWSDTNFRKIYLDGTLLNSPTSSPNSGSPVSNNNKIASSFNTTTYFDGDIAEIIIFSEALTSEDMTYVTNYLRKKWSI